MHYTLSSDAIVRKMLFLSNKKAAFLPAFLKRKAALQRAFKNS
jgi:hypothetical protein